MAEIIVSGIEKSFEQDRMVLDGVSFQVDAGERVGLLPFDWREQTVDVYCFCNASLLKVFDLVFHQGLQRRYDHG